MQKESVKKSSGYVRGKSVTWAMTICQQLHVSRCSYTDHDIGEWDGEDPVLSLTQSSLVWA